MTPTPRGDWRERFDQKFTYLLGSRGNTPRRLKIDSTEEVKDFIATEIVLAEQRRRNETPANMRPHSRDCCELWNGCRCVSCECKDLSKTLEAARHNKPSN